MKQIGSWILKNILIPVFKAILVEFGKLIIKFLLDMFKQNMNKWKTNEENKATTDEEKEIIIKKWDERIEDLEKMKSQVDSNIDKIVDEALKNSKNKVELIQKINEEKKLISK